ncbi:branched-chain amino acid transport system ATP-binding protein [Bradyrhizobium sp. AZCC 2262]|uniref:ABC transporter ATP-binding protein n=1 Tax=Bradyrhizobium sp. AZCC 2262 TaxID=3117022 RepID=UPI002FF0DF27
MLKVQGLVKHFGGVRSVDGIDFTVRPGEIFGLIGPNGSGKSTTVNLISGLYEPTSGQITFEGRDIANVPAHRRLSLGLARTFQNIRLFTNLTVWENLWMAENSQSHCADGRFLRRWIGGRRDARERITRALEFSGLAHRADQFAGSLAFGEQRRLELARALAAKPKLLLLDEPAAGMNAEEIAELDERIRVLQKEGYTILLIEHHMELVMAVTDRICVLNFGRKIAEGTPAEVQANSAVREAYLGTAA